MDIAGNRPSMTNSHHETLSASLEKALTDHQTNYKANFDASHDIHHARRVKQNALAIAAREGQGDQTILIAAAYLHDLVNVPKNDSKRHTASRLSADAAQPILVNLNFSNPDIAAIAHCIEAHSFSANIEPTTLEAKILQDADRLESLGALGIARTFYTAAKLDSELFDGADPFAKQRPLDDKRFAIDHFKTKLLTLAGTMKTDAGKAIADERTATMRSFLVAMADEIGTSQSW